MPRKCARPFHVFFASAVLSCAALAQAAAPPPSSELETYLDTIHKAGRSELAWGELLMVSSVKERVDLMSFEKFGEVYVAQYQDRFCGVPGHAERPEVLAAEKGVDALLPLADFDRSGFVSTAEAKRFRSLFELGRSIPYVVEHEKTTDAQALARALRRSVGELASAYAEYPALTAKDRDLFPPLPPLQGLPPAGAAPGPAAQPTGDDFQALAAQVRASGLSEHARLELLGFAAIRAGALQISARKDPESGHYGTESRRIEKDAGRSQALSEPQLAALRPLADFDGSGFVTSEEALRLMRLFVLGREVPFVAQQEATTDGATVARLLSRKPEELQAQLADYAHLAERAPGDLFPALPALRF